MVAIMYPLTPVDGISFTRNHASIVSAINNFEGRKFRYEPRNQFEEQYARYPTEQVEIIRNDVVMTALRGAATRLGSLREGRKAIIFVSEGLTAMLPPQMRSMDASMPGGFTNPVGAQPDGRREQPARGHGALLRAVGPLLADARRVHRGQPQQHGDLQPRPARAGRRRVRDRRDVGPNQDRAALQFTQDTLRTLSDETDGRAIVNRNDLAGGLSQVVRDSSAYYLIGYTSPTQPDGKFHDIKVRVKRRGVEVRARKGFWAATADDAVRASTPAPEAPRAIQNALASIATSVQSGKYVRTWIGTERAENGKTRVTLVWEPLPQLPGVRRDPAGPRVAACRRRQGRSRVPRPLARCRAGVHGAAHRHCRPRPRLPGRSVSCSTRRPATSSCACRSKARAAVACSTRKCARSRSPTSRGPRRVISTPRVHRARTVRELQAVVGGRRGGARGRPRVLADRASADPLRRLRRRARRPPC